MAIPVMEDLRFMTRAADRLRLAGLDLLAELTTARSECLAAEQERLAERKESDLAEEIGRRAASSQHLEASVRDEILRYEAALVVAEVDFSVRAVVHGGLVNNAGASLGAGYTVRAHDHYEGFQLGSAVSDARGHYAIDFVPGESDGTSGLPTTKEGDPAATEGAATEGEAEVLASSYVDLSVLDPSGKVVLGPTSVSSFYPGTCREKRLGVPNS